LETKPHQDSYLIGDWQVLPGLNQLQCGDEVVQLEPKVMAVLGVLASKPGEVFSRQELEDNVWQDTVVGYDALSKAINKLREAMQDDKKNPRYIQTLSKKGYRLVAEVSQKAATPDNNPAKAEMKTDKQSKPAAAWIIAALLIGVGLLVVTSNWNTNKPPEQSTPAPSQKQMDEKPTIVILPFQNIGQSKNDDYLADGLTSDLTTNLSKLSGLWVTASNAAQVYKDRQPTPSAIKELFNARYVLSGEVNKHDNKIRINTHLTDLDNGNILWAERYDRQLTDLFAVQDEVTKKILQSLSVTLTKEEKKRLSSRFTDNLLAYELYQRGQVLLSRRTPEDNAAARDLYKQAVELDSNFGRAYSAIAMTYAIGQNRQWPTDVEDPLEEALSLAEHALRLNEHLAESYWVTGFVYGTSHKPEEAIEMLNKALLLSPNYSDAYAMLAFIRIGTGKAEQAIQDAKTALYLNPAGGFLYNHQLGKAYYFLGEHDNAIKYLELSNSSNPVYIDGIYYLAAEYAATGEIDSARWMLQEAESANPGLDAKTWLENHVLSDSSYREKLDRDLSVALEASK
jgi:adenylate cyclase